MYNVMIVDDEPVIKKGLNCFINWKTLECNLICEANNAIEAQANLTAYKIDIVITDIRMPGMDGIELSKFIYNNYPHIKVIILTAFADFEYAQSAIKYNVVDFIIKANPTEKIPEALRKAINLIALENEMKDKMQSLETKINANLAEMSEKFFKDVFNDIITDDKIIAQKTSELNIILENYFILAFDISDSEYDIKITSEDYNSFISVVKNFLSVAFKNYTNNIIIADKHTLLCILSFENSSLSLCTQTITITCNELLTMVKSFMKFNMGIGVSNMHMHINDFKLAYLEAKEALSNNFYIKHKTSFFASAPIYASPDSTLPTRYIANIIKSIQEGNIKKSIDIINMLLDDFKKNEIPVYDLKAACMQICSACFRLLGESNILSHEHSYKESHIYKQIQECRYIGNLSVIMCNSISYIFDKISSSDRHSNYIVNDVNKYIRENYKNNINLQAIAKHIHVNSSYLSRLYKKETGQSIVDAINKHRVEIAKRLLKHTSNKVFEIASLVGIDDPAYFTHVFTKYSGISPKEYKSMI